MTRPIDDPYFFSLLSSMAPHSGPYDDGRTAESHGPTRSPLVPAPRERVVVGWVVAARRDYRPRSQLAYRSTPPTLKIALSKVRGVLATARSARRNICRFCRPAPLSHTSDSSQSVLARTSAVCRTRHVGFHFSKDGPKPIERRSVYIAIFWTAHFLLLLSFFS